MACLEDVMLGRVGVSLVLGEGITCLSLNSVDRFWFRVSPTSILKPLSLGIRVEVQSLGAKGSGVD